MRAATIEAAAVQLTTSPRDHGRAHKPPEADVLEVTESSRREKPVRYRPPRVRTAEVATLGQRAQPLVS